MQTAAMTSRFLTGCSSKVGLADSEIMVSHGGLIQHLVVSHLAQTVYSQETFLKLTYALIHFAEQAYTLRDLDALQEVSQVLMNLPVDAARQIGLYYRAIAINRRGQIDEGEALLETVANNAPITYRGRAIQTLGANHHDKGQLDEALRFQREALRVASDKKAQGLQTTLLAHLEISHFKSDTGDHKGALAILESLSPLVQIVSRQSALYFYFYHNELAVEFGELGRIAEAQEASEIALASPYAPAYPNWAETRLELEAKRTSATPSVVAINRAPETELSPQPEPQRKPHRSRTRLSKWLAVETTFLQTASKTIAVTAAISIDGTSQSVLDRVLISIGPRAPPALP
jgi:tetratricopeptide (TPR) repeat protein